LILLLIKQKTAVKITARVKAKKPKVTAVFLRAVMESRVSSGTYCWI